MSAAEALNAARQDAAEYGYTIDSEGVIWTPTGKRTGVIVTHKRHRLRVEAVAGRGLIWSGASIARFLEAYWYAKKRRSPD